MRRYLENEGRKPAFFGSIPTHWDTVRCAHLFQIKNITKTSDEINLSVYRDYGVVKRDSRDDNYNRVPEDTSNYKLVEPGDFVFNKMKCWQGSLGVSEYRGIVSPAYTICSPKKPFHGKYLHYLLRSRPYVQELRRLSYGVRIGQWELRFKDFKDVVVPYPSVSEQTQIANFLDHKTAQIDELIRAKERKIELLGEYRASLIQQVVTKGLDPNVEMKPSGLEWIGEIPKSWSTINTKYLFRLVTEPAPKNNDYELLSIYTDIGVKPRKELEERGNRATTTDGYWLVKKGDFIVNKLLAWMGAIGLSNYEGVTSPAYDILRKIRPLNERFYEYLLRCGLYFTEFKKRSRGIMDVRLRLYFSQFGTIPLVFPPVHEQHEIVNFLDRQTEKIDKLRSNEEHIVKLLKEYRQSIISEVVTGKIDVRGEV